MKFKEEISLWPLRRMIHRTHMPDWQGSYNRVQQEYSERPTINIQVSPPHPDHSPAEHLKVYYLLP